MFSFQIYLYFFKRFFTLKKSISTFFNEIMLSEISLQEKSPLASERIFITLSNVLLTAPDN